MSRPGPASDELVFVAPTRVHRVHPDRPWEPVCGRWISGDKPGERAKATRAAGIVGLPPCRRCWPPTMIRVNVEDVIEMLSWYRIGEGDSAVVIRLQEVLAEKGVVDG